MQSVSFYVALSTACLTLISFYEFFSQYIVILTVRGERATEQKFQGAKVPGNERAREQKGLGELARERIGQSPTGRIRSGKRIGPGAKRLGTSWLMLF